MVCPARSPRWTHVRQLKARSCTAAISRAETPRCRLGGRCISSGSAQCWCFPFRVHFHCLGRAGTLLFEKTNPHSHNQSCSLLFCLSHGTIRTALISEWTKISRKNPFPPYFAELLKYVLRPVHGYITLLKTHNWEFVCQSQITSILPKGHYSVHSGRYLLLQRQHST